MGNLANIDTFGDVAAEDDDAVLTYFLKTDSATILQTGTHLLCLGRKGSGKTALTKYFAQLAGGAPMLTLSLRDYPWTMHAKRENSEASPVERYSSSWRYLIAIRVLAALLPRDRTRNTDEKRAADTFLKDNYGGINPQLGDILRPSRVTMKAASLKPSVMGVSLGSVEFQRSGQEGFGPEVDALTDRILATADTIASQMRIKSVAIHFDELDQGLSELDDKRSQLVVGLVVAARMLLAKLQSYLQIHPVVYLRTDIWEQLSFSDKNKIAQSRAHELEWNPETLKSLINERLKVKLGEDWTWDDIDDGYQMRGSQAKWSHIVARTFMRPRDVIQFLNCALEVAKLRDEDADYLTNEDIQTARTSYSTYLKKELDDEIKAHWPEWTEALQALAEMTTITFTMDDFRERYNSRKSKRNELDADEALETLYRFSVVGYRGGQGSGGFRWIFQYADPQAGWDNGAKQLKVHQGLKEYLKLREERAAA